MISELLGDLTGLREQIKQANNILQNPKIGDTEQHTELVRLLTGLRRNLNAIIEDPLLPGVTKESRKAQSRDICGND